MEQNPRPSDVRDAAKIPEVLQQYKDNPERLYEVPDDDFFKKISDDPAELEHFKEQFLKKMSEYAKREMTWFALGWQLPPDKTPSEIVDVAKDRLDRLIPIVLDLIKAEESQYRDALTGGYSADGIKRRYYIERDRAKINHSEEDPKETVLIEFDVDSFKGINDTHGHHAGDLILKAVIEKLRATLRATDAIGRRSGDEFSVILSQVRKEEVQTVLQKMVAAVQEILNPAGEPISVTGGARIIEATEEIHFEKASEEADTAGVHQKIANPGTIALSSTDYSLDLDTAEKRVDWATKVAKRKLKRLIDPFYAQLSKPDILPENKKNVEQQVDLYETHVLPTMVQIELLQIENEYGKLL